MEENCELEEGETCYNEDDDDNLDPDIALSYIDERIKHVLGHFLKDFEGGMSAENLGAKFGGYGSFLPPQKHSSPIPCHESTQQKNCNIPNSPDSLPLKGASKNLKAPSNLPQSVRLQTNSCSSDVLDIRKPSKDETSIRPGCQSDLKSLKVRIKVRSDDVAQRNSAIYNGLGLYDSASSSSGDSLDGCERKSHVEDSLDNIIQVMTSFSVPGGLLISPLPESLLWLSKKKSLYRGSESMASLNSRLEHSSKLIDEMASLQGDAQLFNDKKSVNVNENQELEHENKRRLESGKKFFMKTKSEEVVSKAKKFPVNGLKCTPLFNLADNYSESIKAVGGVPEISCEVKEVGLKDKSLVSKFVKEEMLVVHDQDYGKNDEKSSSTLVEKALGNRAVNSYDNDFVDLRCDDTNKSNKTAASLIDYNDASKCVEDIDLHVQVLLDATTPSENESYLPPKEEKSAPSGKKILKGLLSDGPNGKTVLISKMGDSRAEIAAVQKVKNVRGGVYSCKSKTDKLESHIGSKIKDNQRDLLENKNVESFGYSQVTMAKATGDLQNEPNIDSQRAQSFQGKRSNERFSSTKIDTRSIDGESPKDGLSIPENGLTSDIAPGTVAPLPINDNWVGCDRCQKWRLLPFGVKPEHLPEKWLCSMLNWLPGMNRCEITEDETTAAVNALYQLPVLHTNGTASGPNTSVVYHCDQHHQNSSQGMSDQGKEKQKSNGMKHAGGSTGMFHASSSSENHVQEPKKSRSINDKNCSPEPTLIRKSEVQNLSKLCKMAVGKNEHSLNAKARNGVDAKQLKMKSKRKHDDGHRPSKSSKSEDTNDRTCMKNNETSFSEVKNCGRKDDIPSMKKLGEQTQSQTSSDGGSLYVQGRAKRNFFTKNRKLKEKLHCQISALADGVYVQEESSENGLIKEGKAQLIKSERKFSSSSDGNSRKKVRKSPFCSSGSRDFRVDVTEEAGYFDRDLKLRKCNKNGMSEQMLDAIEPEMKVFGSGQVSISPIVSNSISAVVQSVSPPLRMSNNGAESGCEIVRKEKFCSDFGLKSMKNSTQYGDTDAMQKISSESVGSQLFNGDSNIKEQIGYCTNNSSYGYEQSYQNEVKKTPAKNALFLQKEVLYSKNKDMASTSEHKSFNNFPKKIPKIESDVKLGCRKMSRNETNHTGTNKSAGKRLIDNGMDTQLEDHDHSDLRMGLLNNTNGQHDLQQKLSMDLESENKVNTLEKESRSGKSKCLLNYDGRSKQAHQKAQDSQQLLYRPESAGVLKETKLPLDYGMENGGYDKLGDLIHEKQGVRNLSASSPDRMESFSMVTNNTLEEAKDLRKYADRLKSSGFHFESNEAYFQAALKFLHGASLLETYNAQNGKPGEVSQMQFYHCTVELLRACADEYEKRQQMVATALTYKCMEVACMRIVYCKHFCLNRDRQELQVTLHRIPQEPQGAYQTSASDNVTVDKAVVSIGTSCSAAGNQVIVARNLPSFVRLLDCTQIVNLAMEASRKSINAFAAAANVCVEETQNRDFVASVKRVIDFSFQDVEELIQLVHLALKVSSYSGFGGT